jgi:hypothetical protein
MATYSWQKARSGGRPDGQSWINKRCQYKSGFLQVKSQTTFTGINSRAFGISFESLELNWIRCGVSYKDKI